MEQLNTRRYQNSNNMALHTVQIKERMRGYMLRTSYQDAKHIQVVQTQFLSTCEVVKSLNKQTHTVHVYLY